MIFFFVLLSHDWLTGMSSDQWVCVCIYPDYLCGSAKSLLQFCVTESFSILYIFPQHHPSITVWQHLNYSGLDVQMTKAIWIDLHCFLFSGHSGLVDVAIPHFQMSLSESILVWFLYAFPFRSKFTIFLWSSYVQIYCTILDEHFIAGKLNVLRFPFKGLTFFYH